VPLAEDQHPVGDLDPQDQHEAFGEAVRPWTAGRDLDHFDAPVRHGRVEGSRELTGPVADEESDPSDVLPEIHDEVAGLLRAPGPVGMSGPARHTQVVVADRECEQGVEPLQRHRAVDMEEVDREHAAGLCAQELMPDLALAEPTSIRPVGFQDPATGPDQRFQAVASY
jgi:hypothetical protein